MSDRITDCKCKPTFYVCVFGNWRDVIGVRAYRDALIDQKPDYSDAEEAEHDFSKYTIPCGSGREVHDALAAFTAAHLQCEVSVRVESPTLGVGVFATTNAGYGSKGAYSEVSLDPSKANEKMAAAIRKAHEHLTEVYGT